MLRIDTPCALPSVSPDSSSADCAAVAVDQPPRASFDGPRGFDLLAALLLLVSLGPLIILRGLAGWLHSGRIIDRVECVGRDAVHFHRLEFTGPYPGARLANLFNLLLGDLALAGPRPYLVYEKHTAGVTELARLAVRPGIFSIHRLRRQTGIDYEAEQSCDAEQLSRSGMGSYLLLLMRCLVAALIGSRAGLVTRPMVRLLGVEISNGLMSELLDWITRQALAGARSHLTFVNADCLNIACRDTAYREVLDNAQRVVADGIGVRIACRMKGHALRANLNGTDLFPKLCERLAREGLSIYLLGARPDVAAAAGRAMQARYSNLKVAGTHHGYFSSAELDAVIADINASGADVLLVAMGAPRQELWLAENVERLLPPVRMGVGGLFDFYAGRIPRAPQWLREVGMEWCYRIYQEPRRMWRRYIVGNPLFLFRVWRENRRDKARELHRVDASPAYPQLQRAIAGPLFRRTLRRMVVRSSSVLKRLVDLVFASLLLLVLSPLLLIVALLIRIESPGPVLFRQTRVGRHGKTFDMWKFRSMHRDAEQRRKSIETGNEMRGGVLFKMRRDPRITWVGRLIRKTSIDELPQLWNVVRGDMSLVGPRPALSGEVDVYRLVDRRRLDVKPGITCLWQISGRSDIPFAKQVQLDVQYIQSQSLLSDLVILLKTIPAVISGRGAY